MNSFEYIRNGKNYYNQKLYNEAISEFSNALEIDPNNAEAYEYKGCSYYFIENIEKALENLNLAIELNPNSSNSFCYRGACYCSLQKQAISSEVISFNKPTTFGFKGYTFDKVSINDIQKCISDENKAIELDKNNLQAYHMRGVANYWLENYEQALTDLNKVIKECPNEDSYDIRSRIYYFTNNYESAIKDCTEVIKLNPNNANTYDCLGRIYYMQEDFDKAFS